MEMKVFIILSFVMICTQANADWRPIIQCSGVGYRATPGELNLYKQILESFEEQLSRIEDKIKNEKEPDYTTKRMNQKRKDQLQYQIYNYREFLKSFSTGTLCEAVNPP